MSSPMDTVPHESEVCTIVPPYLLEAFAKHPDPEIAERARRTLATDARRPPFRAPTRGATTAPSKGLQRTIGDAKNTEELPGQTVRTEGQGATGDPAADEAYDGLGDTYALYSDAFKRDSLDGNGLPLLATVHYGQDYDNAFFNGEQMVFGDGDGKVFQRFTLSVDVIGHELTHGVTAYTANLDYSGQSGALNEHISDAFGSMVKQKKLDQTADQADWLVGAGLFTPVVHGVALRSMKEPGTAYDDPQLGKDPQPADMSGYVDTTDDNGGVHLNSGIPNRAFALAAVAIGGKTWEGIGLVWYDVLTGSIETTCDFATFAGLTVSAAGARFGEGSSQQQAVQEAWITVGVLTADAGPTPDPPSAPGEPTSPDEPKPAPTPGEPEPAPTAGEPGPVDPGDTTPTSAHEQGGPVPPLDAPIEVRRSGGVGGITRERTVTLSELPEDEVLHWQQVFTEGVLRTLAGGRSYPDTFVYSIVCVSVDVDVTVAEPDLPSPVRDLLVRTLQL
jgi:Thermolysin metallopeptidase, alpha-helical domain/Thermolysin metallopeptidase, catalytic domain/Emfourin